MMKVLKERFKKYIREFFKVSNGNGKGRFYKRKKRKESHESKCQIHELSYQIY